MNKRCLYGDNIDLETTEPVNQLKPNFAYIFFDTCEMLFAILSSTHI